MLPVTADIAGVDWLEVPVVVVAVLLPNPPNDALVELGC